MRLFVFTNFRTSRPANVIVKKYFRIDLKSNGLLTSLPFLMQSVTCFTAGYLTDVVRRRGHLRTLTVRRVNTGLGLLVPAAAVVAAGHSGCNAAAAVAFFVVSAGFNTFTVPGCKTR